MIIDDHALFAESLELAVSLQGYDVRRVAVPETSTPPAHLLATVHRLRADLVLLDLDLGGFGDAARLVRPLVEQSTPVVIVTASSDHARWGECLFNGARTVLDKTRPLSEIMSTVRHIHRGLPVATYEEREWLVRIWRERSAVRDHMRSRLETLTPRERDVLGLLMDGHSVREIAREGVVSEATVRTQVKSILLKLEVSSQLAAVSLAHQLAWSP